MDFVGEMVRSCYNEDMILLNKWVMLNESYIERIKEWGISKLITNTIPVIEPSQFARIAKIAIG